MENVDFHDFLDRMRNPAAADLVRSIKSFIMDLSSKSPDPENDSKSVQDFISNMEETFKSHPLWAGATDEELESAGEGLEKYLMTKLFSRVFAPLPEDAVHDQKLFEKICLLQQFVRPENLDIPPKFQNETSWLLAQKELQKINTYKAPRDKLVSILNCSRVILNICMATNENPPGADEFLPVLIYVTIKANPPQLHSNLLYIQRYRHQSRLVSEAAYFYTNLVSAESFIENIDATSLSLDEKEFERKMQAARGSLDGMINHPHTAELLSEQFNTQSTETLDVHGKPPGIGSGVLNNNLQNSGSLAVLDGDRTGQLAREFPFLYASVGDLRVEDVESLLNDYKELVLKYYAFREVVDRLAIAKPMGERESKSSFSKGIDHNEEGSVVQMTSDLETIKREKLSEPENESIKTERVTETEEEGGSSERLSGPQVVDGSSDHNTPVEMEDKDVTFVSENSQIEFNLNALQENLAGTVGDNDGGEEKNIIEQHEKPASGNNML